MSVGKINNFFGYGLLTIGISKILIIILALMQVGSSIFNGGSELSIYFPMLSSIIGWAQIFLALGSIIMIVVNMKKRPKVIIGYLYGLGAILIEFITPPIILVFLVFAESGLYMKAGDKIRKANLKYGIGNKKSKDIINETEWFFSEKKEQETNEMNENTSIKDNMLTIVLIAIIGIVLLILCVLCLKVLGIF